MFFFLVVSYGKCTMTYNKILNERTTAVAKQKSKVAGGRSFGGAQLFGFLRYICTVII